MNAFFTALKTQIYQNELCHYGNKAESLLEMLFYAYTEINGFDNSAIQKDFDELYAAMNCKTLREMDEGIYPCAYFVEIMKNRFYRRSEGRNGTI